MRRAAICGAAGTLADERKPFEVAEATVDAAAPTADVQEPRRRVHEQGCHAIERMVARGPE